MRNGFLSLLFIIVVVGFIASGYFIWQQSQEINRLQTQISALSGGTVSAQGLPTTAVPAAQTDPSAIVNLIPKLEPVVARIDVTGAGFQASGSGFIVDARGYLVTNQHVIDSATAINVTLYNGQQTRATVAKSDKNLDLAILKLSTNIPNLPVATLGSSSDVVVGSDVVAAGFPVGLDLPGPASFTRGIISAKRSLDGNNYIQTDVTINPGNSGGCLVTLSNKVIGVTTAQIIPPNTDAENVGLVIPVDVVQSFIQGALK